MRAKILVALIVVMSLALPALDKVQPLNVKVGLWEVTTIATPSEGLPIPAAVLEKWTPEQRARMEERMKAASSDPPRVTTRKHCLTREQVDKGATFGEARKSCTRTVVASTSNKLEIRIECVNPDQGIKSQETLREEAVDSGKVKGSIRLTVSGDRAEVSTSTFTARWIGPVCSAK